MRAMSDASPAVRFEGVTKKFGDFTAVNNVSYEVPRGSLYGILGSNGAGKTTSIRMLMNIFKPTDGTVEVLGSTVSEKLKPRIGYLPEERGLYKKMRIHEMLQFFGRLKGRTSQELEPRIDFWLERMGLQGWRDQKVEELSKGMSQKLQFVLTVIHEPELVVLDEPFAGLDPVNRDVLRDAVLELKRAGTTVVFSTHVMEQAEQLCENLVMIHQGQIHLSGSLDEIRDAEGREAVFIGYRLRDGQTLDDLPGVTEIHDRGNEAELFIAPDADPDALLKELIVRAKLTRFDLRKPSLHEIFKRVAGSTS